MDSFAVTFYIIVFVILAVVIFFRWLDYSTDRDREQKAAEERRQREIEAEMKIERERRELEENVKRFENNPRVIKAAEDYATAFIDLIIDSKGARDIRNKVVKIEAKYSYDIRINMGYLLPRIYEYGKCCCFYNEYKHGYGSSNNRYLVDFSAENLKPLETMDEMKAFAVAIAKKVVEIVKERYPKDESGTEYTLEIEMELERNRINFVYTAPNGFYEAPSEW